VKYTQALITIPGMECRALKKMEGFQRIGYTKELTYAQVKVLLGGHKDVLEIQVTDCLGKKVFKSGL